MKQLPIRNMMRARASSRDTNASFFRRVLLTLMVIGGVGSTISAGTFASFNASTTNQTSTISSGSLVLGHKVNAATACLSTAGATSTDSNDNSAGLGCTKMINNTLVKLGDTSQSELTIFNAGDLAGQLSYRASTACTSGSNSGLYSGGGDMCSAASMVIQEYTTAARTTPTSTCVFPYSTSSACPALGAGGTAPFQLPSVAPQALGPIGAAGSGTQERWFLVKMQLPNTASDALQGVRATFALTWTLG